MIKTIKRFIETWGLVSKLKVIKEGDGRKTLWIELNNGQYVRVA